MREGKRKIGQREDSEVPTESDNHWKRGLLYFTQGYPLVLKEDECRVRWRCDKDKQKEEKVLMNGRRARNS